MIDETFLSHRRRKIIEHKNSDVVISNRSLTRYTKYNIHKFCCFLFIFTLGLIKEHQASRVHLEAPIQTTNKHY